MRILYCPPLSLLWSFLPGDGSPASLLHKFYARAVWRERGPLARLRLLGALLVSPVVAVGMMGWVTWLNGAAIKRRSGKGILRQISEQLYLVVAHDVLPPWYYIFELFEDGKRRRARDYLHRFETKGGIFRFLKRTSRANRTPLSDKLLFAARCSDHGLPSVPIFLIAENGEFRGRACRVEMARLAFPRWIFSSNRSAAVAASALRAGAWRGADSTATATSAFQSRSCSHTSGGDHSPSAASYSHVW